MRERFKIPAVPSVPFDRRAPAGDSKMMKEAKGFVRESETFQYVEKPDGFDGVHMLLAE
jgi:hypothetical protein